MAEASSFVSARAVQIRAPPSLTSCIDIVNRATAPYHNERPTRGAIISFDFKYPSSIFFVGKEAKPKFDMNFTIQIEDEYGAPIGVQAVKANHFNLDNNIAELLIDSKKFPTLNMPPDIQSMKSDPIKAQMHSPDDYANWGDNNVRFVVLSSVFPSKIDVSVSLSTIDGAHQLQCAFIGGSRPYAASSPDEEKLRKLLCWSAGLGYDELFKAYLDQVPLGLEKEDAFGMTPFSWAAQNGWARVVRLALQEAGSICARRRTARGPAPLEAAARSKNGTIFMKFLKWLKYLENPIPVDTALKSDEIPEAGPDLSDVDIEREIQSAVRNDQTVTIQKLVELLRDRQGEEPEQGKWLANKIVKAAEDGELYLVQALRSCGANVNCEDNSRVTPLMGAMNKGNNKVAEYLILQGASDDHDRALHIAVITKQHSTIRALLKVKTQMEEALKQNLLEIATKNQDSTTLMLLQLEKGTEKLATLKDLDAKVDRLFEATVVTFHEDQSPEFQELSVKDLMRKPETFFDFKDSSNFKWFHLPANNMKWAEMPYLHWDEETALNKRSKFLVENSKESYSNTTASPPAGASTETLLSNTETQNEIPTSEEKSQREEMLLRKYLLSESEPNTNARHVLHIRRTLDQSLYHNLQDTKSRDEDQTVRRYQKILYKGKKSDEVPYTVIMVDQLWLWILLSPSGKAQTVVTCFPSRDWFDVGKGSSPNGLDPRRTTDVLQTTKSYIQQRPDAVKTPYDLAGVIASRCSRALLDHSTDMLDFTEAYENSISYIMNEEVLLFNTFNHLMQTRTKAMQVLQKARQLNDEDDPREADSCLANNIIQEIEDLNKDLKESVDTGKADQHKKSQESKRAEDPEQSEEPKSPQERLQQYRQYTMDTEIPNDDDIKGPKKPQKGEPEKESKTEVQRLTKLFEKFGRFFVLDITREISLLRQIKDIQDEFEMMEKIFTDQKEVIEALDRIIRAMIRSNDPHDENEKQAEVLSIESNLRRSDSHFLLVGDGSESTHGCFKEHKRSNTVESYITDDPESAITDEHLFAYEQHGYLDRETQKKNDFMKQAQSIIWQFRHQKQNLPIRTVNRFAEQIKRMNERAKNTNQALNTLVDLKQKQNNMIDTRTARLQADQARVQAEQTHTMAKEAERQGRTLMVFTVVTIIFLPLSFIAAFFAIPVKEFGNGSVLTIDFVSTITFPVSAATSLLIIVIGFAASEWEWIREYLKPKVLTWAGKNPFDGSKPIDDSKPIDGGQRTPNQNEVTTQEKSRGTSNHLSDTARKRNDSIV